MRHLLYFLLSAIGSLWLVIFFPSENWIGRLVMFLTYPILLATFGLWMFSLFRLHKKEFNLRQFLPQKKTAWIAISAVTFFLLLYEPFEFKIVYDELLLSVSAELFHFNRISGIPQWANDYSGSYIFLQTVLDKRPLFFPFLLSLVHDFTGYRYENVFFLNAFLTFFMMVLIYSITKVFSTHRGGLLAVFLAGSLPLLSIMASSGHFEILNIVMILMTLALSYIYLKDPSAIRLIPLVYCLVLLSQVRYENSIYLLPFGILILLGWKKSGRIVLPWQVILCPLFLIVSTLHYRVILDESNGYFQAGPNGRDLTFSLSYATENLQSAINFLFSIGQHHANSYMLSALGFVSIALFCVYLWKRVSSCLGKDPKATVLFIFSGSILLLSIVLVFFNFGLFDWYITSRLSLPMHLLFIILVPFVAVRFKDKFLISSILGGLLIAFLLTQFFRNPEVTRPNFQFGVALIGFTAIGLWIWKGFRSSLLGINFAVCLYILTIGMPVGYAHRYSQKYVSNDIVEAELAFLKEESKDKQILWISAAPYPAFLLEVNTTSPMTIKAQPTMAQLHLLEENYDEIYFSRRMTKVGLNEYACVEDKDILDPEVFHLEVVKEIRLNLDKRLQINRLVDVTLENLEDPEETPSEVDG